MPERSAHQQWLQQARKNWGILIQGAVWVIGIIGTFLVPPPVGVSAGDEKIWLRLGQFIIAVVLGLVFFAAQRWNQKTHARWWCLLSLLFLLVSIGAFFQYQKLTYSWTGNYVGKRLVLGSVFTREGAAYTQKNPTISCDDLLFDFAGKVDDIWTRDSINHRRLVLAATYVSCMPMFTICLIGIVQALQCLSLRKRNKTAAR